jgi:hypothetical protein
MEDRMLYAVKARFLPGVEAQRAALSGDFGQHIRQPLLHIRMVGALQDDAGRRTGVLMLMEADTREQLDHFLAQSPYGLAGLYESVDIDGLMIEAGRLG